MSCWTYGLETLGENLPLSFVWIPLWIVVGPRVFTEAVEPSLAVANYSNFLVLCFFLRTLSGWNDTFSNLIILFLILSIFWLEEELCGHNLKSIKLCHERFSFYLSAPFKMLIYPLIFSVVKESSQIVQFLLEG